MRRGAAAEVSRAWIATTTTACRERHFGRGVLLPRKGAVRAQLGDLGVIPGSMGACSYIVQ